MLDKNSDRMGKHFKNLKWNFLLRSLFLNFFYKPDLVAVFCPVLLDSTGYVLIPDGDIKRIATVIELLKDCYKLKTLRSHKRGSRVLDWPGFGKQYSLDNERPHNTI